jgi:SpoVK/Ycf46/Vps4 family AAA+-type ATPase
LETYGLTPNRKLLFYGPPGTGKTLTAKVLSSILGYPLVVVKFEAVISSYLGETSTNLRKIFDFIEEGQWVVLFDEFDVVGKKRDDPTEHGEIKRVVNNFMLMLEDYSGESIILASTNHPHILDNAVWRRFDDVVYFDMPDKTRRELLFRKNLRVIKKEEIDFSKLATMTKNFSGADIERACLNAVKKSILGDENILNYDTLRNSIDFEKKRIECQNKVIK